MKLDEIDKKLLMELQYNFPYDKAPFRIIAEKLKVSEDDVIERIKRLVSDGIIRRIGMYVSFRAKGMESALVAADIPLEKLEDYRRKTLAIKEITHNYIRNHPKYNVWFVIKAESRESLEKNVKELLESVNSNDYIILYSKKTLKLSVKYDILRGISYSEPEEIVEKVPTAEELGIQVELLKSLSYPLPITKRPFEKIAETFRISEEEIIDLIKELRSKGVIKDYGATINGEAVGITENAMVLLAHSKGVENLCYMVAKEVKEATHVVLREANKEWHYLCYFMIHGSSRSLLREAVRDIVKNAESYMMLFSLENLKPGIVI